LEFRVSGQIEQQASSPKANEKKQPLIDDVNYPPEPMVSSKPAGAGKVNILIQRDSSDTSHMSAGLI
jgi:hypothetical protein